MNNEQMELFNRAVVSGLPTPCQPSARVVAFPVDRQVTAVRAAARQLERRHGQSADKWWQGECLRLHARLRGQGLSDNESRGQIDRFALAVYAEMRRAAYMDGGDAA